MEALQQLIRKHLLKIKAYSSARDEYTGKIGIFLDANENSLGSASEVLYNRYPDPHHADLKAQWAEIKGVKPQQVFFGNGSDEPIDLLMRLFCEPHQEHVITMPPTYGMYAVSAEINAVENKIVPLTPDFEIDVEAVLGAVNESTKMIFICSPNNPSGNLLNREAITTILDRFKGIVVVDEAYIDFANEPSWCLSLDQYPNLVVLQTLSKAWGMAGIRVGVAMAHEYVVTMLDKIKPPYNLSEPNQILAMEALTHVAKKEAYVYELLNERDKLQAAFEKMPLVKKVVRTDANFILVQFDDAKKLFDYLISKTLIVRDRSSNLHCDGCLRITVGTPVENEALLQLMDQYKVEVVGA